MHDMCGSPSWCLHHSAPYAIPSHYRASVDAFDCGHPLLLQCRRAPHLLPLVLLCPRCASTSLAPRPRRHCVGATLAPCFSTRTLVQHLHRYPPPPPGVGGFCHKGSVSVQVGTPECTHRFELRGNRLHCFPNHRGNVPLSKAKVEPLSFCSQVPPPPPVLVLACCTFSHFLDSPIWRAHHHK